MSEKNECERLFYTDLAVESAMDAAKSLDTDEEGIPGVRMAVEECETCGGTVKVTKVFIEDEAGAAALNKPIGTYVTLESNDMKSNDILAHEGIIKVLVDRLAELSQLRNAQSALIVGLGNRYVTPDALGPRVVSKILITRFLGDILPDELTHGNMRRVSAVAPGVLGTTGIETGEIVKGITEHVKPDVIIAIDALAARSAGRINSTIQFADTGLAPGSGVGSPRFALNTETLGVPVIAIGVPTVVDAATLVNDTLGLLLADMIKETDEGSEFYGMLESLGEQEKYSLIKRVLDPYIGVMFVTPKDVDAVMDRLSNIIANALNIVLHPGISKDDINRYMY